MNSRFEVKVPGKWVLTGEHAVLRGQAAVALPHSEFGMTLSFEPKSGGLIVHPATAQAVIADLLQAVSEEASRLSRPFVCPEGVLTLESSIPIGAGLGSSAALCVAMTHWLAKTLELSSDQIRAFATHLENHFHGKSSGMDIAVIEANRPIFFEMGKPPTVLPISRLPCFSFHDTGVRCRTHECVAQVQALGKKDPALATRVDELMGLASKNALEGLIKYNSGDSSGGLSQLTLALQQGQSCFESWDLMPEGAHTLVQSLLAKGALAVKLTGAGGGGMLVALWPKTKQEN